MGMHLEGPMPFGWTKDQRLQHARLSLKLTAKIFDEKMPAVKRLESFRYMAKKFPGVGWEEAVRDTEAIVAKANG